MEDLTQGPTVLVYQNETIKFVQGTPTLTQFWVLKGQNKEATPSSTLVTQAFTLAAPATWPRSKSRTPDPLTLGSCYITGTKQQNWLRLPAKFDSIYVCLSLKLKWGYT